MQQGDEMKTRDQILEFVADHISSEGYAPTIREIAAAVGLKSSSTVQGHVDRLEKDGLITRRKDASRTIQIVDSQRKDVNHGNV